MAACRDYTPGACATPNRGFTGPPPSTTPSIKTGLEVSEGRRFEKSMQRRLDMGEETPPIGFSDGVSDVLGNYLRQDFAR